MHKLCRIQGPKNTDGKIIGLMAIMKNNQEPVTRIGDTWRPGGQVRPDEPAPRLLPPASPALSTSSSSDSSIGD